MKMTPLEIALLKDYEKNLGITRIKEVLRLLEEVMGFAEMCGPFDPAADFLAKRKQVFKSYSDLLLKKWRIEREAICENVLGFQVPSALIMSVLDFLYGISEGTALPAMTGARCSENGDTVVQLEWCNDPYAAPDDDKDLIVRCYYLAAYDSTYWSVVQAPLATPIIGRPKHLEMEWATTAIGIFDMLVKYEELSREEFIKYRTLHAGAELSKTFQQQLPQ